MPSNPIVNIEAAATDVGNYSTKQTFERDAQGHVLLDRFPSHAARVATDKISELPLMGRPDGAIVTVGDVHHFVGKDVLQVCKAPPTRGIGEDFLRDPAYMALMLGGFDQLARHHGASEELHVQQLVLGLPVSYMNNQDFLRNLAEGIHQVPGAQPETVVRVYIEHAQVVAQPQGALFAARGLRLLEPDQPTILLLDMGGGTLDWLVSSGMRVNYQRCGSTPLGTLKCAEAAASLFNPEFTKDPYAIERIDEALRRNLEQIMLDAQDYFMNAKCWAAVDAVLGDAIGQVRKSVGSMTDIGSILLTGGGSHLLARAVNKHLDRYSRLVVYDREPVTANARGFHLIAETLVARRREVARKVA